MIEHLQNRLEASQAESKDLHVQISQLKDEILEIKYERQRSTLLHVLVAKLKEELDRKEKQMNVLKLVTEELHSQMDNKCKNKINKPVATQSTSPVHSEETIKLNEKLADFEMENGKLVKINDSLKNQLEANRSQVITCSMMGVPNVVHFFAVAIYR